MKIKHCFTLLLALSIAGCVSNKNIFVGDVIFVDVNRDDKVSFFDIFDKIEIILLDSVREALFVPHKAAMKVINDDFYILDKQTEDKILVFGPDGKLKKKIEKAGRGPGEYAWLYDFGVNRFTNNLELMTPYCSVYIYDIEGDFIESFKLPETEKATHFMHNLSDDIYVFYNSHRSGNKLVFYSKEKNKIIGEAYDYPDHVLTTTANSPVFTPFYVIDGELCFVQIHNGTVFTINPDDCKLYPKYVWDFGEHNLDLSLFSKEGDIVSNIELENRLSQKYPMYFTLYGENHRYVFNHFLYAKKAKSFLFDKLTGNYKLFAGFEEGVNIISSNMDDNAFYICAGQSLMDYCLNPELLDEKNRTLCDSIEDADDTPVIIKYIFKNRDE